VTHSSSDQFSSEWVGHDGDGWWFFLWGNLFPFLLFQFWGRPQHQKGLNRRFMMNEPRWIRYRFVNQACNTTTPGTVGRG
jgi:hypothetical protein